MKMEMLGLLPILESPVNGKDLNIYRVVEHSGLILE